MHCEIRGYQKTRFTSNSFLLDRVLDSFVIKTHSNYLDLVAVSLVTSSCTK